MTHPYPVAPANGAARPTTVTVSSYLLMLVAALSAVGAIISLTSIGTVSQAWRDVYRGDQLAEASGFAVALVGVGAALLLLWAAVLVILAILNNRGRNASRIVTWVLGGLSLCCSGLSLLGNAVNNAAAMQGTSGPEAEQLQRRLDELTPAWQQPVGLITNILTLVAMLAALILLALPASNAFFRKPAAAGWMPPGPGSSYPSAPPPYPSYPGQQQQYPGQQPPPAQPPFPGQQYPGQQPYPGSQYPGQQSDVPPPYPGQESRADGQPATDPWDQANRSHPAPPGDPSAGPPANQPPDDQRPPTPPV